MTTGSVCVVRLAALVTRNDVMHVARVRIILRSYDM
jgi:hypothetical protein